MSVVEEDVELRDLLAQILEKNGSLAKLRAELRASIFLALDEDIKLSKQEPLQNLRVQSYLETPEGKTMFCLVREFLEFFNLQFTISVYEPESYLDSIGQYEGRQKVAEDLGLNNIEEPTVPLLQQLLKIAQTQSRVLDINLNLNGKVNDSLKDASLNIDRSYKKTDSCSSLITNSKHDSQYSQENNSKTEHLENGNLNTTFDINSPTVACSNTRRTNNQKDDKDSYSLHKIPRGEEVSDKSGDVSKSPINTVPKQDEFNKTSSLKIENNGNFNVTYELSSPTINASQINHSKSVNDTSVSKPLQNIKEDDTYEDTSSIAEDSEALEKPVSVKISEECRNVVPYKNPSSSTVRDQIPPNISSLTKPEVEKSKLSLQRSKCNLSSLSDLPPLSLNKSRVSSDILPSLYSKELKNKSNLKELDKMFDMEADYEEDFIFNNELSLNSPPVNLNQSKHITITGESFTANKTDLEMLNIMNKKEPSSLNKVNAEVEKSIVKSVQTNRSNLVKSGDHSNDSSISKYTTHNQ